MGEVKFYTSSNSQLTPIAADYCSDYAGNTDGVKYPSNLIDGSTSNKMVDKNGPTTEVYFRFNSQVTVAKYRLYRDNDGMTTSRLPTGWTMQMKPGSSSSTCSTHSTQIASESSRSFPSGNSGKDQPYTSGTTSGYYLTSLN